MSDYYSGYDYSGGQGKKKGMLSGPVLGGIIAAVVLIGGGVAAFVVLSGGGEENNAVGEEKIEKSG